MYSPDRRLVVESCRQGGCVCTPLTGDLLSSLVGRGVVCVCVCVRVYSLDRRLVVESCRQGVVCVYSPDRRLVVESCRQEGCVCVLP